MKLSERSRSEQSHELMESKTSDQRALFESRDRVTRRAIDRRRKSEATSAIRSKVTISILLMQSFILPAFMGCNTTEIPRKSGQESAVVSIYENIDDLNREEELNQKINALIKALGDQDEAVRKNAVLALVKIGKPAVDSLIKALEDKEELVRGEAAIALGEIKDPRAVEPLIDALGYYDNKTRENSVRALTEIGKPAVEPLIKALGYRHPLFRYEASEALGHIGDARAVEPLIKVLGDSNRDVSHAAVRALGEIGEPAVKPLIKVLEDEERFVREVTVKALGLTKDTRCVESLIKVLEDEDEDELVRGFAETALGRIGDIRAVKPLLKALEDEEEFVRRCAAEALGEIGDERAIEPLIKGLLRIHPYATHALIEIGEPAVEPLIKTLADKDLRSYAAGALIELGKPAVEALIKGLGDKDYTVRCYAAWLLGIKRDTLAVEPLIKALSDKNERVRGYAAGALGEIDDPRAKVALKEHGYFENSKP